MRLRILGELDFTVTGGEPTQDVTRQTRLLLACLALVGARRLSRAELCALFWPDRPSAQARSSLRQALAAIRKALTSAPGDADAMSLQSDLDIVKLVAKHQLLARPRRRLAQAQAAGSSSLQSRSLIPNLQGYLIRVGSPRRLGFCAD